MAAQRRPLRFSNIWQTRARHCSPILGVTFRANLLISCCFSSNSIQALLRNINTVTMTTCDVSLHHVSKTMLHGSIRGCILLPIIYTLDNSDALRAIVIKHYIKNM